jgi:CRP/FNR family transcriptional regulator, anaerobic regulatory protein
LTARRIAGLSQIKNDSIQNGGSEAFHVAGKHVSDAANGLDQRRMLGIRLDLLAIEAIPHLAAIRSYADAHAVLFETIAQHVPNASVVIDDQNGRLVHGEQTPELDSYAARKLVAVVTNSYNASQSLAQMPQLRRFNRFTVLIRVFSWEGRMISIRPIDYHLPSTLTLRPPAAADCARAFARQSAACVSIKVKAKHRLWSENEERSHIYLLRSGAVAFSRMLLDGRRAVIGFAYPGDVIGLGSPIHPYDAEALMPTRVEAMPIAHFNRCVSEDETFRQLAESEVAHTLASAYSHLVIITKLTAAERIASFLMDISMRNACHGLDPNSVLLPMRRADIADYLGIRVETLSRTLTVFRAAGLITMDEATLVRLKDRASLEALALGDSELAACCNGVKLAA